MYRLKANQEPFRCCGGPFERRYFTHGEKYSEIPPEEADRFEDVDVPVVDESQSDDPIDTSPPLGSTDPADTTDVPLAAKEE